MDKNLADETNDIILTVQSLHKRAQQLEHELNSLQTDLDKLATTLDQVVGVYEFDTHKITITQADVESIRAQLNRTYPEDRIQLLALVNKLEATRTLINKKGVNISDPVILDRWTLTWGIGLFLYAVVSLVIFIAGYFIAPFEGLSTENELINLVWYSMLAGGIGGGVSLLYILAYIRPKRKLEHQYTNAVYYLVQPIIGAILGVVFFFFFMLGTYLFGTELNSGSQAFTLLVALSWVVGYRQHAFLSLIEKVVQNIISQKKKLKTEQNRSESV